jgi:hypothetical protein
MFDVYIQFVSRQHMKTVCSILIAFLSVSLVNAVGCAQPPSSPPASPTSIQLALPTDTTVTENNYSPSVGSVEEPRSSTPIPSQSSPHASDDVLAQTIANRIGMTIGPAELLDNSLRPADKDTPCIYKWYYAQRTVAQGNTTIVIFRTVDEGLNLYYPTGFKISDQENGADFKVVSEAPALYSCVITFKNIATIGEHNIVIRLTDVKGNSNTQKFTFQIIALKP